MADQARPGAPGGGGDRGPGQDALDAARHAVAARAVVEPSEVGLGTVTRLSGGASRQTWRVGLDVAAAPVEVIVQRDRSGSGGVALPMSEQADLLRAAAAEGVPVPEVLASGEGGGTGFVVLELLAGESVPRRVLRDPELADARAGLAREAGAAMARIHRIPTGAARLPGGDPLAQMRALLDLLGEPHPAFELGLRRLEDTRPDPSGAGAGVDGPGTAPGRAGGGGGGGEVVVHGDFRMGNLLVAPRGITAVLDWELAHLGSPAEDLGWFCCRAWRFGSPRRAGGVGTVEDLLDGYASVAGGAPAPEEVDWWEAYGALRWGLICVLQASTHLTGRHRSVELASIGRRAAECEEDLMEVLCGPSAVEPTASEGPLRGPHDRPTAVELLEAVEEHLVGLRDEAQGATAFHLRVAANAVGTVAREIDLAPAQARAHAARLAALGMADDAELAGAIRSGAVADSPALRDAVRAAVRDKLAVSHPGYWLGDG